MQAISQKDLDSEAFALGRVVWSAARIVRRRFTLESPVLQVRTCQLHSIDMAMLWRLEAPGGHASACGIAIQSWRVCWNVHY